MKNVSQRLTECSMALFGVLFAQSCFLHGSDIGNTRALLLITVVMELVILMYLAVSLLQFVWHYVKAEHVKKGC